MTKKTYVCERCGSKKVEVDALARWDEVTQSWFMTNVFEHHSRSVVCNEEGCESHRVKKVDLDCDARELYRARVVAEVTNKIMLEFPEKSRHKAWAKLDRMNSEAYKTINKLENKY
tara:strand:+ start:182 stop:529 length:348 start_codon:yes stop_codon:yes gene_type:complete